MAIKGKKAYTFHLTEDNVELVKEFVDRSKMEGGMSALVDGVMEMLAETLRASGVNKRPMNYAKVIRLFVEGIKRV